jgi:hypothetical protein
MAGVVFGDADEHVLEFHLDHLERFFRGFPSL